jgi:hypothetical protein
MRRKLGEGLTQKNTFRLASASAESNISLVRHGDHKRRGHHPSAESHLSL